VSDHTRRRQLRAAIRDLESRIEIDRDLIRNARTHRTGSEPPEPPVDLRELLQRRRAGLRQLDQFMRELRDHDLGRLSRTACEREALKWLRRVRTAQQLLEELRPDPLRRPSPFDPRHRPLTRAVANRILRAVQRGREPVRRLDDLRAIAGVDDQAIADLRHTGCTRLREPEEPVGPPSLPCVLLPLRLETRFDKPSSQRLRLRIIPDEPWFSHHDPQPSDAELEALGAYLAAGTGTDEGDADAKRALAWGQFVRRHGGGRAVWLHKTFRNLFDEHGRLTGERPITRDEEPRFPQLVGFPSRLEVWLARGGGDPERAATLEVDAERLLMDLPLPPDPVEADTGEDGDEPSPAPEPEPRWWDSWDEAVAAGLATTIDLGESMDDIDVLYVVGVDGGDPNTLFGDHCDAGMLGLIEPGTPTSTVNGAPAADRQPDAAAWSELLDSEGAPLTAQQRRVSEALTGDPEALGLPPGGERTEARPLVAALWPALWGHALRDVWGLGRPVDDVASWAGQELAPEGPFPTLRIGSQPYGLLPVTSLERWQPHENDLPSEAAMIPSLIRLRAVWAEAAERAGTVAGADAQRMHDLLSLAPTSTGYRHRLAWPLETWFLSLLSAGFSLSWETLLAEHNAQNPLIAELGLTPRRRYGSRGWAEDLGLPLVLPPGMSKESLGEILRALARVARDSPYIFISTAAVTAALKQRFEHAPDSLLLRLLIRSLQFALADLAEASGRMRREFQPLNDIAATDQWDSVSLRIAALRHGLGRDPEAETAFGGVTDAIDDLADFAERDTDVLERMLRATLDCAMHRIDPWIVGLASRRLRDIIARAPVAEDAARLRLGAYGWVDRPRPGNPGPTATGLLHAPSDGQATTAAILRDRAINDPEPERWHMNIDSASARAAERLATYVRGGVHLSEALGAEVERAVGDRKSIDKLRSSFPLRKEHDGRRLCDGQAVLSAANPGIENVPTAEFAALRAAVDAYGDLLVAEAIHDIVEGRADAAAAAMDAAAGLARPPELDVLHTRHEGHSVASTCVVVLADANSPQLTQDAVLNSELSPGSVADPAVASLLIEQFHPTGDPWRWEVARASGETDEVALDDVGLKPVDALALPLADLERLVTGPEGGALTGGNGSERYRRAVALLGALGVGPADPDYVVDLEEPSTIDTATELRSRLARLRIVGAALRDRLLAAATDQAEDEAISALQAATRWGIAPMETFEAMAPVALAERAGKRLAARLKEAPIIDVPPVTDDDTPVFVNAADLDANELASSIAQLASATGHLAVLARMKRDGLTGDLQRDTGAVEGDWLPTVAAVREPMARLEAVQLIEEAHGEPALHPWTNRPDDVWQTAGLDDDAEIASRRLVVAYATPGLQLDELADDTQVAVGLIDRWSETIPGTHHATAAAFGFNAPASRAPQAILLAAPPAIGQPLDTATVVDILVETRTLIRARMAGPGDLTHVAGLLPTALLPAEGPSAVSLEPTPGADS
jgi:hypothetical protein